MTIATMRGPVFCGAPKKETGEPCRNGSGKATDHPGYGRCKWHGGNSKSHRQAASIAAARETAVLFGVPRNVDPITGMLETYHSTMGVLDAIEAKCMQLLPAEVVWGITKEKRVGDGEDGEALTPAEREYGPGVNIWVKLLAEWHDRAFSEAERILKVGLDSRRVELEQSHVLALVTVLLDPELELTPDQRRVVARRFRERDMAAIEGSVVA